MMSELFVVFAIVHFAIAASCGYLLWVHFFTFVNETYDRQIKLLQAHELEKQTALTEVNEKLREENRSLLHTIGEFEAVLKERMNKK